MGTVPTGLATYFSQDCGIRTAIAITVIVPACPVRAGQNELEIKMKTIVALACIAFLACFLVCGSVRAASDQKEVENRVELNNAKVEQIVKFGVVTEDEAKKIINLREELGGFQSYDDLLEVIPKEKVEKLKPYTTIKGIASDCTC